MQDLELKHLLVQTSLIHIFIVSGSHFLFLRKILARIPIVRFCPLFPLGIYCLATLCQPPAVRSWLFLVLSHITERGRFFTPVVVLVFLSCAASVCIFPQWIQSRSLLMSLMAALVVAVCSEFWGKERETLPALFITQSTVFFVMGFCLWGFSNLHPLSILLNLILGPLIGSVIFPLALLIVIVPWLAWLFDGAMNALTWILTRSSEVLGDAGHVPVISLVWQWALFLFLNGGAYVFLIWHKRRKARHA